MNNYHTPVLLQEVLTYLALKPGKKYIDGTLGGGGHTKAILDKGGVVFGIDVDQDALDYVRQALEDEKNLTVAQGNFQRIDEIAKEKGFEHVAGILLDIGVSSYQVDTPERGFSFQEGPLDMRMNQGLTVKAQDLVNGLTEKELQVLFERLGEERFAKKIAKVIVERRKTKPFETTQDLADEIKHAVFRSEHDIHPATRVFQALRIAVNDELNALREALPKAVRLLEPSGRLVVISFHSLEDRIVKHTFEELERDNQARIITKKPVQAQETEVFQNRRSRSAKLRVIERI